MRLIDKAVTGNDMAILADDFFAVVCPKVNDGKRYNAKYLAGKLEKLSDSKNTGRKYYLVYKYLFDNLETLIKGTPDDLDQFNENFETYLVNKGIKDYHKKRSCKRQLKVIFHGAYHTFRYNEKYYMEWFKKLNIKTCPYCNRNWVSKAMHQDNISYSLFFDIDHFWPKSDYPWLAISFSNLIPSCTVCNQRIKLNDKLYLDKHIHPYKEDLHTYLKFNVPVNNSDVFFDKNVDISLEIIPRSPRDISDKGFQRAKNTFEFFNLKNLYDTHLDYVRELLQRDLVYSKEYINSLLELYGPEAKEEDRIFESDHELIKMVVGNYVLPEQIHERPLSKLSQDVLEDFTNRMIVK